MRIIQGDRSIADLTAGTSLRMRNGGMSFGRSLLAGESKTCWRSARPSARQATAKGFSDVCHAKPCTRSMSAKLLLDSDLVTIMSGWCISRTTARIVADLTDLRIGRLGQPERAALDGSVGCEWLHAMALSVGRSCRQLVMVRDSRSDVCCVTDGLTFLAPAGTQSFFAGLNDFTSCKAFQTRSSE